ncbi:MAG: hypothetical protein LBL90_07395, partial [Prevotellaceae bacterium]|nr:hypothetical protein [Prevotellaceae bacterium]
MDIDISKNYWFSLKPHAYASIGVSEIFLYNTLSGQYINSENPFIVSLIQSVHENINLGVVLLEDSLLKNNDIKYFIEKTCEYGIGEVIDVTKCKNKPIRLMPVLN